MLQADQHLKRQVYDYSTYRAMTKVGSSRELSGHVGYLGQIASLSLIIPDGNRTRGEVHYFIPQKTTASSLTIGSQINEVELSILQQRGALTLPAKDLCDELIYAYFKWVHPLGMEYLFHCL